ncbi:MAG: methylenetetrahydrofolate dehydrogenase / methenyltetrahydrofolate cyclohydrolase [Actinomycetota bacterium]|nr:methylenetetrahydrofolate dehydrogenase / methenyltetrahydrofolate cyclohydrolase [Actinomycetota bacterium]
MAATIIDGKATAAAIRDELRERVGQLTQQGITPGLATVLIGDDPSSHVYVRNKHRACADVGIDSFRYDLPADVSRAEVLELVAGLNADPKVDGFLIQHPVPDHLDYSELVMAVDPAKDVDGLHPTNLGYLALGASGHPRPGTPRAIVELLARYKVPIDGRHVVIVGRGTTAGRPLAMLLSLKEPNGNATVTQCHTRTQFLPEFTRQADILVAAAGRAGLITAEMVKPGAAVIDVGVSRSESGISGDVAPDVREVAGWLSPVPGGVGPMTIVMLMRSTVELAEQRA